MENPNTSNDLQKKKKKKVVKKSKPQPLTKSIPQVTQQPLKPTRLVPKKKAEIREININEIGQNELSNTDHRVEADGVLAGLITPIIIEDFYNEYFGLKHLHIKRSENVYKNFFTKDSLDKMLRNNYMKFTENVDVTNYVNEERITLNPEGRAYPSLVWKHYKEGCSVRLLNPQTFNSNVWKLCSILQGHFKCGVGANIYLTPAGAQGFAPHYDDVDVFILQLEGKKEWRLYHPKDQTEVLPKKSSENFAQDEIGEPYFTCTLEAGDLLYFPRGVIHQAVSPPDVHSLHITVSTYLNNTWGDLIGKVLNRALEIANEDCLEFREGLPRDYSDFLGVIHSDKVGEERRKELLDKVGTLWDKLGQYLPVDVAADQMHIKYLIDSLPTALNQNEKKHSIEDETNPMKIKTDTRFRLIRQDSVRLVVEDIAILFHNADNTRVFHQIGDEPGIIEFTIECVDALEHIIDSYPAYIAVKDLPVDDDDQKVDVVSALYEKGLIMFEK
ncbi:hypothetical protein DICPUDRAFT_32138 [Dictyostelium purpureum]|uniref:Bifunctional lysine-specific demethylase and histidyl-hydroxylase n=1 Tax=Dictyostelium purpureum TaxID=5786 RepID=F0ZII5_DICPU|nr:uncharacterized protein DICPUDRAFT_32138 [Dictyostelium purpureum]EGC36270.1 hypothetical protein DICPUDRAFT_32138 [Dictyostelium purpureum]|eukprot:XP_003287216.1 hypothetical protein DICPUDRAFT_32138 [Dictyostelium purpureum]